MESQLIEITQDDPRFNGFIGSWLCRDGVTLVVDVGPAKSAHRLVDVLKGYVGAIDFVLLTHIHIDHAGALAEVAERFPTARVICHRKAMENLEDPSRLWEASRAVLQGIAEGYGSPRPIAKERLVPHTENPVPGLKIIETPGHAPHHLSFLFGGSLFVGEAGGNYYRTGDREYLRPATPPRFLMDVFLSSVDRLLGLEDQPIHYAHFGAGDSSHRLLKRSRQQLLDWHDLISQEFAQGAEDLIPRCVDVLLKTDPNLGALRTMNEAAQARERFFIGNAVRGFVGYIEERAKAR